MDPSARNSKAIPCILWLQNISFFIIVLPSFSVLCKERYFYLFATGSGRICLALSIYIVSTFSCGTDLLQWNLLWYSFKNLFIYLFIFRDWGREGEREGEKCWCARDTSIGCLSYTPYRGPGPQPRHVPWLGIEPVTFKFAGRYSAHWAIVARAVFVFWKLSLLSQIHQIPTKTSESLEDSWIYLCDMLCHIFHLIAL